LFLALVDRDALAYDARASPNADAGAIEVLGRGSGRGARWRRSFESWRACATNQ
jgi:hypothetical protein